MEASTLWDWGYALDVLPQLLRAMRITLLATVFGMGLALAGGLFLALLRRSRIPAVSRCGFWIIEFIRGTPLLIQLYFYFYVLPDFGIRFSPFATGLFGLGLHYSAYMAEVYRAGIDSVPKGQWEAAVALNFSRRRTFFTLILPQAVPPIVPAAGNYLVAMFKDTPLLSAITVAELMYTAKDDIGSETFRYIEPMTLVGLLFLAVSLISARGVRGLERKMELKK